MQLCVLMRRSGRMFAAAFAIWAAACYPQQRAGGMSPSPGEMAVGLDKPADSGPDVDAQLQEIERTKRLMRELGEMHAGKGPGGLQPGGVQAATQSGAADAAAMARDSRKGPTGLPEQDGIGQAVRSEARELAGTVAGALPPGITGGGRASPAGRTSSASSPAIMDNFASDGNGASSARREVQVDEGQVNTMLDNLIDEIKPWAIGFAILFGTGYAVFSWVSSRATRLERHAGRSPSSQSRRSSSGQSKRRSGGSHRSSRSGEHKGFDAPRPSGGHGRGERSRSG